MIFFSEMISKQLSEEITVKLDKTHQHLKNYIAIRQIIKTLAVSCSPQKGCVNFTG